jgi:stage V sporulation protein B
MGYYQSAYTYYTIILLISSYSIPAAISKVIAQKLAVKEYRNAHRVFVTYKLFAIDFCLNW